MKYQTHIGENLLSPLGLPLLEWTDRVGSLVLTRLAFPKGKLNQEDWVTCVNRHSTAKGAGLSRSDVVRMRDMWDDSEPLRYMPALHHRQGRMIVNTPKFYLQSELPIIDIASLSSVLRLMRLDNDARITPATPFVSGKLVVPCYSWGSAASDDSIEEFAELVPGVVPVLRESDWFDGPKLLRRIVEALGLRWDLVNIQVGISSSAPRTWPTEGCTTINLPADAQGEGACIIAPRLNFEVVTVVQSSCPVVANSSSVEATLKSDVPACRVGGHLVPSSALGTLLPRLSRSSSTRGTLWTRDGSGWTAQYLSTATSLTYLLVDDVNLDVPRDTSWVVSRVAGFSSLVFGGETSASFTPGSLGYNSLIRRSTSLKAGIPVANYRRVMYSSLAELEKAGQKVSSQREALKSLDDHSNEMIRLSVYNRDFKFPSASTINATDFIKDLREHSASTLNNPVGSNSGEPWTLAKAINKVDGLSKRKRNTFCCAATIGPVAKSELSSVSDITAELLSDSVDLKVTLVARAELPSDPITYSVKTASGRHYPIDAFECVLLCLHGYQVEDPAKYYNPTDDPGITSITAGMVAEDLGLDGDLSSGSFVNTQPAGLSLEAYDTGLSPSTFAPSAYTTSDGYPLLVFSSDQPHEILSRLYWFGLQDDLSDAVLPLLFPG